MFQLIICLYVNVIIYDFYVCIMINSNFINSESFKTREILFWWQTGKNYIRDVVIFSNVFYNVVKYYYRLAPLGIMGARLRTPH